jgi:outer membrane protein OmpA-like peptidoglycan-associated protein/flagellar hook assembly protein FlgD
MNRSFLYSIQFIYFLRIIFLIILLSTHSEAAEEVSIEDILFLSAPASSQGRGGASATGMGSEHFFYNPAAVAGSENSSFSLNYTTLPFQIEYTYPGISAAFPTSYGVIGISARTLVIPGSGEMKYGSGFAMGIGKHLTPFFSFGAALNSFYCKNQAVNYYSGIILGGILRSEGPFSGSGFGFFKPALGISLNAGFSRGDESEQIDRNSLNLGYSFGFLRGSGVELSFFNDFSALDRYTEFPVKAGLEILINQSLVVRTGIIYPDYNEIRAVSMGLGYRFSGKTLSGSINYSAVHYRDYNFIHSIGFTMEYSTPDIRPPETQIEPNHRNFSPGNDGNKDYVTFKISVNDESRIKGWKLQILDSGKNLIREYSSSVREFSRMITAGELLSRIFRKKEAAVIPGEIIWDGRDRRGIQVKDGKYIYRFHAWDIQDNISIIKKGILTADTQSPAVTLSVDKKLLWLSPYSGKKRIEITHKFTSEKEDIWTAGFRNREGTVVKSYRWRGKIPATISWNGTGERGKPLPDGIYTYFIESTDPAGNSARAEIREIAVTGSPVVPDMRLSKNLISGKKTGEIILYPSLTKREGLLRWGIDIEAGNKSVRKFSGNGPLPPSLKFNLTDNKGRLLNSGLYGVYLTADYGKEQIYRSPGRELRIDSEPPRLSIEFSPGLFSPDNDSFDDTLEIRPEYDDFSGAKRWVITIYSPSGKIFKTFTGEGKLPEKILWNGKNYKNELVESASDYFIELTAEDRAGNISRSEMVRVPVDVLVLETAKGYRIEVNRIDFRYRTDRLKDESRKILERIYEKIDKYRDYTVHVKGHTDDRGSESENLALSEKRAERVMKFLVKMGIPPDNIEFTGMGETMPLFHGSGEEIRRRNRRIVITLERKERDR